MLLALAGRVPGHGRRHQHPGGPAPAALRVVAPAAPLRLPRRRPRAAAPAVDRAGVPRPRPAATVYWWTLWAAAAGAVLVWRVGLPVCRIAAPRPAGHLGRPRGRRRRVGLHGRPRPATGCRVERGPVPHLALPDRPGLDPRAPLLALGRPGRPQPADHRQGARRRQRARAQPAPRHPRAGRGPVRAADRPRPHPAQGRAHRRRRRHHAAAGAGRGAALRPRRRRAAAARDRAAAVRPRARRARRASAACRCCGCPAAGARPTPGSATAIGAGRRPRPLLRRLGPRHRRPRRLRVRPRGWTTTSAARP